MSNIEGYKAKTKMVSSYAWDTAITLIQILNDDYGSSSIEGNYIDTSFEYIDINGLKQNKSNGSSTLVITGQTEKVCNIYDMGGNYWEFTTERYSRVDYPYTVRGGFGSNKYALNPSGYRDCCDEKSSKDFVFRVTLFL